MPPSRIEEAATALGLTTQSATGSFYGELEGFPAQLAAGLSGRSGDVLILVRYNAKGRTEAVASALAEWANMIEPGLSPKDVSSDDDSVVVTFPPSVLLGEAKTDAIASRVRAAVGVLKAAAPDNSRACRHCGASEGEPALLEGEVDRLCAACIAEFQRRTQAAEQVYDQHPVNLPRGLLAALAAGLGGAVLYAVVIIASNKMFWFLAVLTGLWVGWFAVKGAGKVTMAVQVIAAAVTIISVIAGFMIAIGYQIAMRAGAEGATVDWLAVLQHVPDLLVASGPSALFSLAGGVIGAWYVFRSTRRPRFDIVEKK